MESWIAPTSAFNIPFSDAKDFRGAGKQFRPTTRTGKNKSREDNGKIEGDARPVVRTEMWVDQNESGRNSSGLEFTRQKNTTSNKSFA